VLLQLAERVVERQHLDPTERREDVRVVLGEGSKSACVELIQQMSTPVGSLTTHPRRRPSS